LITWLELFGYIGTALVLASMMMTSIVWLRILNMAGSVVSLIYALLVGAQPVVFLNLGMVVINLAQLARMWHENRTAAKFDA
jgi:hypothetical protein